MKKCNHCKEEKLESEFHKNKCMKDGLSHICKSCRKELCKKDYEVHREEKKAKGQVYCATHREEIAKRKREYYLKTQEEHAERNRVYYNQNRDTISERSREYNKKLEVKARRKEYMKEYRRKNKERISEYKKLPEIRNVQRQIDNNRYNNDIQYKLRKLLRGRLRKAVQKGSKAGSAVRDLGCSIAEFKIYMENQFLPGMTWTNWGKGANDWQIDHIKPLHLFDLTNRKEFLQACHYTNLRPLWFSDNMSRNYEEFK